MSEAKAHPGEIVVSVSDAAARGQSFASSFGESQLSRLAALVAQSRDDSVGGAAVPTIVSCSLRFAPAVRPAMARIRGEIEARFGLMCQRCLEVAALEQVTTVDVVVVDPELPDAALEEAAIGEDRWDHAGDELSLTEFVDEFVLLSLPLVVRHADPAQCGALANSALAAGEADEGRQKPFADLASLMAKRQQ